MKFGLILVDCTFDLKDENEESLIKSDFIKTALKTENITGLSLSN